jgi:hypothetical protein
VKLECVKEFGNFEPGDTVEVPEGAVFDTAHFVRVEEPKKVEK